MRAKQRTGSRAFGVVFKIGDLIANRYRVVDILGSGGAGVVYRVRDQEIDVDVAVKVINAKLVQAAEELRLFARQTKIARKLSHQNVVRIYDEGRDEDRPYTTMQLLDGLSLRKIIDLRREKQQVFTLAEIEPIFNQLCQALDYAHKTTFHGDLKPDNVIVLPDLLKVTDFAILRGLPRKPFLAIQKSRGANFRYLAPEVRLEVTELDRQVDIYSLGVILCEMLTGVVFDDSKPDHLATISGIDPSIFSVVKRAVARAPRDRYLSAGALHEDIRAALLRSVSRANHRGQPPAISPHVVEQPTQRLEIDEHGPRPVDDAAGSVVVRARDERQVETSDVPRIRDSESSGDGARPVAEAEGARTNSEGASTGAFAAIDDAMIESSSSSSLGAVTLAMEFAGQSDSAPSNTEAEEALAPVPEFEDSELEDELFLDSDSETEALLDPLAGFDLDGDVPQPDLLEISNSAIHLIADPRKTNLIRVDTGQVAAEAGLVGAPSILGEQNLAVTQGLMGASSVLGEQPLAGAQGLAAAASPTGDGASIGTARSSSLRSRREDRAASRRREVPLTDSALPAPAFGQLEHDDSEHEHSDESQTGLLEGGAHDSDGVSPTQAGSGARGRAADGAAERVAVERRRPATRSKKASSAPGDAPEARLGDSPRPKSARARPMTRPRMPAIGAGGEAQGASAVARPEASASMPLMPLVGDLFDASGSSSSELLRPPTGARPLVVEAGAVMARSDASVPLGVPSPSRVPQSVGRAGPSARRADGAQTHRAIMVVLGFAVLMALVGLLVLFKLQADQQAAQILALETQMLDVQRAAQSAREAEANARREATAAGENAIAAREAEQDAARAAREAEEKRSRAEKAASTREAEAKRLAATAASAADLAKKTQAEKAAKAAQAEAESHRKAAEEEARREKEEHERADRERARREKEENAQREAEARAAREAEAKESAEQRARALREQRDKSAQAAPEQKRPSADKSAELASANDGSGETVKSKAAEAATEASAAAGIAAVNAPAPSGGQCPKGMAFVEGGAFTMGAARNDPERNFGDMDPEVMTLAGFCMDYYEYPNGRERAPSTGVSFKTAVQQCKTRGKRLCSEAEWEKACKGPSGTRFPYGNQWDPTACATEDEEGNDRTLGKSGDYKRCRSGFNVFDLSGNVAEWTSTEFGAGAYVVKGGSADRPGYDARCAARKKRKAAEADALLGFRCCADPK